MLRRSRRSSLLACAVAGALASGCTIQELASAPPAAGGDRLPSLEMGCRIPAENIQQVVRRSFPSFRACYELGLLRRGRLEGRVVTRFVIDRDGSVPVAVDGGSDFPDREVVACIVGAFRELHFPPLEGNVGTVVYPLVLTPLASDGTLEAALAEMRAAERASAVLRPWNTKAGATSP